MVTKFNSVLMDENTQRYYRALNLEPTASPEEIYQAYRDLSRVWEPERFQHSPRLEMMAEEKLKEIIEAYRALQPGGVPEGLFAREPEPVQEMSPDPFAPPPPAAPVADRYRLHDTQVDLPPLPKSTPTPRPLVVDTLEAPQVADRYRLHDTQVDLPPLPESAPPPRPVVVDALEAPQVADRYRLHDTQVDLPPLPKPEPPPSVITAVVEPPREKPAPAPLPAAPTPPPTAEPLVAETISAPESAAKPMTSTGKLRFAMVGATLALIFGAGIFLYQALSGPPPRPAPVVPALAADPTVETTAATTPASTPTPAAAAPAGEPAASETATAPARGPKRAARRAAPQPEPPPSQFENGAELMTPQGRGGAGRFRIVNQSGQDAVARIASQSAPDTPLRLVYIQSGGEVNISGIGTGVYFVSFSIGPVTSKLRPFGPRYGPFQFVQIDSVSGTQSDQYQIILKPRS